MYISTISFLFENEAMEIHSSVPGHCIDHSVKKLGSDPSFL